MAHTIVDLRPASKRRDLRARELAFDNSAKNVPLPEYKPLLDANLRHLWVNPRTRKHMQASGFIDEHGNLIDVDAHRRKLYVIEQELSQADRVERDRGLEKERRLRERQILARRQDVQERQLRQVQLIREDRRVQRERLKARFALQEVPTPGMSKGNASSLPAIKTSSEIEMSSTA
eukprot:gnl/TRDRNA2_/TRDRNA2_35067_c0_seq1.p1 gnl/TRDRNA2_/TRDRNA2_35067_c0~~gnl/TRDRNA2_/TRDRNA2_35067_c0_seq1.p1  ORF type:complete len:176 (+),score=36.36 gnl/TRDRNA2_/TRDRNA2_35067_c0_seq1:65-592(+)